MKRKNVSKGKILISLLIYIFVVTGMPGTLTGLNIFKNDVYALSKTKTVNFPESTSRSRSTTVNIPNLVRITSVTVNTGNVTYSVNGDNVTINVSNGSYTSSYTPSKYISNFEYYSGSSEPPSYYYYSSSGYSGTLILVNVNAVYSPIYIQESREFTVTVTNSRSWEINQWGVKYGEWEKPQHGDRHYIDQDGFKGYIPQYGDVTYSPSKSELESKPIGEKGTQVATKVFKGTLTKTVEIERYFFYGYYSGTVYGSTTYYYSYNVTINYVTNIQPSINIVSPGEDSIFSGSATSFVPVISVSDPDGDTLVCKLFIDSESSPRDTKTVSNTATAQTVSFNAQNIGILAEGTHTMKFTVYDGEVTVEQEIEFTVDKTPPVIGSVSVDPEETSISVTGTATDNKAMHDNPYCFIIGSDNIQWTANSSHTFDGLVPNTKYTVKFMARDKAGNISEAMQDVYTKAGRPSISVNSTGENSLVVSMNDNNPPHTEYLINCGSEYVTQTGSLSQVPEWIILPGKSIEVRGLDQNTFYTFSARARCSDGTETQESNQATGCTLAAPPQVLRFEEISQTSLKVAWDPVAGATGYDIEADGEIHDNGTTSFYLDTGLLPETTHMYRVRVRNAGGTGNWSDLFSCTTLMEKPGVPENITFIAGRTEITLTWDPVADADGYEIEADGIIQDTGSARSFTHYGLEPDSTHRYRVRAKNAGGEGEWSNYISAVTLPNPPEPPDVDMITSEITKTQIKISWNPVAKTDRYEIEADDTIYDAGSNTEFLHENLIPLTTHKYRIRGINAGGTGEWSSYIYLTTHPYEPSVPENVMAASDGSSINLSWYMAAFAYTYEVEIDGNEIVEVFSTNFTHEDVAAGSRHTYRVRAKNISGVSDWTSPVTITASTQQTSQDMSIINLAAIVTYDSITLSWTSLSDDCQYDVEADGVLINNGFSTVFNNSRLEPGTYHEYKIRARYAEPGEWSSVLNLSTLPLPPGAPVITRSFATNTSIQIWWEPVEDAVSYDVEADGIVIPGITDMTFLHEQLPAGSSHQYRVRARTLVDVSPWSEICEKSTAGTVYIIDCIEGETFNLSLLARNVQDFKDITFVVTYDSSQIEVVDLFGGTVQKDVIEYGQIPQTNIIVRHIPGRIEYTVNGSIVPGTSWSGEIANIIFRAKTACTTEVNFIEE